MSPVDFNQQAEQMVAVQLRARGICDPRVLQAMSQVPRHWFVDTDADLDVAYADRPLPIGFGQTISQPYMVARMLELCAVQPSDVVLEVGSGSGYQTALLARLAKYVYACDYVPQLVERAQRVLNRLEIQNVTMAHRDGSVGWPEHQPFNVIVVAAGAPSIPATLTDQLADGGRLVIPVGEDKNSQVLKLIQRNGDAVESFDDCDCRFVPLCGQLGWNESNQ